MDTTDTVGRDESMTKVAVVLAAGALLTAIVLNILEADGPIWIIQGVLGLAAAVTAWRAGGTSPANRPAFIAFIVGTLLFLAFMGFLIAEA